MEEVHLHLREDPRDVFDFLELQTWLWLQLPSSAPSDRNDSTFSGGCGEKGADGQAHPSHRHPSPITFQSLVAMRRGHAWLA
jgi:hypothetical protein